MLTGLCISTQILNFAMTVNFSSQPVRVLNMMCKLKWREQYWWSSHVMNLLILLSIRPIFSWKCTKKKKWHFPYFMSRGKWQIFSNEIKGVCTISILDNDLGTSCLTFVWFQTALIFVWHTNLWCMSLALSYLASQPIIGPIEKQNTCAVSYQPLPISRLRDKFIVPYLSFLLTIDTRLCI